MTTEEAKSEVKSGKKLLPNTKLIPLSPPCVLESDILYDLEHTLRPTDVTNHFSGYPITSLGADVWTCYGIGGENEVKVRNVTFRIGNSQRGGRSCFLEGQLPFFVFWTL